MTTLADLFSLSGKVALVTGARTGLGRGCAQALAAAGADILGAGPRPMPETEAAVTAMGRRFAYLPVDLATAIVFLAAPASGFVTGVLLPVDGGWLAR